MDNEEGTRFCITTNTNTKDPWAQFPHTSEPATVNLL